MYRIGKQFTFEASHCLPLLPKGHKCRNVHGHSYVVEVVLAARNLDETAFVLDFAELHPLKEWIDATLDHKHLNEVLAFVPTVENLAEAIWAEASQIIASKPACRSVFVERVCVWETPTSWGEYGPHIDFNPIRIESDPPSRCNCTSCSAEREGRPCCTQ